MKPHDACNSYKIAMLYCLATLIAEIMWRLVTNSLASHGQPLLKYDECPEYLKTNPYIRTG